MVRRPKPKRGIVILVVLSLLVLFVLLVVTFAIVAGQYRRAAVAYSRQETLGVKPQKHLDSAMYALLRGTKAPGSALNFHSLLRDVYGGDGFSGQITQAVWQSGTGNQLIRVRVDPTSLHSTDGAIINPVDINDPYYHRLKIDNYFGGRVFSVTSGPANVISCRIVGYDAANYVFTLSEPQTADNTQIDVTAVTKNKLVGRRFVVNGAPFNGTGIGYDTSSGTLTGADATYGSLANALLPNYAWDQAGLDGGADESYDAPDFQNMFLAYQLPHPTRATHIIPSFYRPALINYMRNNYSALWGDPDAAALTAVQKKFRRRVLFRPTLIDNPNFDGSNPAFNVYASTGDVRDETGELVPDGLLDNDGPDYDATNDVWDGLPDSWDVDNDGDGVADSIWIDLGMPVQTAKDGRRYKPLFAILCTDLDGRLNVNAHDRPASVIGKQMTATVPHVNAPAPVAIAGIAPADTTYNMTYRGQGYGPPEVSLQNVFKMYFMPASSGTPGNPITGSPLYTLLNQRYGGNGAGAQGMDLMARIRFFDYPNKYQVASGGSFRSPSDLHGELKVGLSTSGQPESEFSKLTIAQSPYEFNLFSDRPGYDRSLAPGGQTSDAPYTAAELERLLRALDVDSQSLPWRLWEVPGLDGATVPSVDYNGDGSTNLADYIPDLDGDGDVDATDASIARRLITTHSFDMPVPGVLAAGQLSGIAPMPGTPAHSVIDLLRARILEASSGATAVEINAKISKLLSTDLTLGMRMDVNRPFGNGLDDNSNGAVDDPAEASVEKIWANIDNPAGTFPQFANIDFNHVNGMDVSGDGTFDNFDRQLARQLYARHLYVLAMTLVEQPTWGTPEQLVLAKRLAQWAINVVDFRDADAIMTPFEYDPSPFTVDIPAGPPPGPQPPLNGWSCDGIVNGYLGMTSSDDDPTLYPVVWGTERPELLFGEGIAWHDRRTEDRDSGDGHVWVGLPPGHGGTPPGHGGTPPGHAGGGGGPPDDDYDQRLAPRSGVFIELYNPWNGSDTRATPPSELYGTTDGTNFGVQLNKATPNGYPVWRMLVMDEVNPGPGSSGMDGPLDEQNIIAPRGIYFGTLPGPLASDVTGLHGLRKYFTNQPMAPILPGRYAMVGSGTPGLPAGTAHVTYVGRRIGATDDGMAGQPNNLMYNETRRIVLNPNPDPTVNQVRVYQGGNPGEVPYTPAIPAVAIAINQPSSLSITEPLAGYAPYMGASVWNPTAAGGEGAIEPALQDPIDMTANEYWNGILDHNGTRTGFANVHLQRLSDPTRDFHATGNPYRTIDTLSIDLTSFNGLTSIDDAEGRPGSPSIVVPDPRDVNFACRQRGGSDAVATALNGRKLWPAELVSVGLRTWYQRLPASTPPYEPTTNHYFNYTFDSTLAHTMGSLNQNYIGAGGSAFPWLTWNNRPFVSQYELTQVSDASSYQLLRDFDFDALTAEDPYAAAPAFPHLMNYCDINPGGGGGGGGGGALPEGPHMYRVLEYLHVPSRFNGTETILNPSAFASGTATGGFHPPFNRVSRFRDPGRININTASHLAVWQGLLNGLTEPSFVDFIDSRRGFEVVDSGGNAVHAPMPRPNNSIPTFFANPFRPPGSGQFDNGLILPTSISGQRWDVETTLLRSTEIVTTTTDASGVATMTLDPPSTPLFALDTSSQATYNDARRNAYFKNQALQRLGNLVTTRSNVYAVWITMGYFEVESSVTGQLGQEIGIDTGEVKRHRAFYVIDRSIPVAFEPGQNHNVDECVLVRRYIE